MEETWTQSFPFFPPESTCMRKRVMEETCLSINRRWLLSTLSRWVCCSRVGKIRNVSGHIISFFPPDWIQTVEFESTIKTPVPYLRPNAFEECRCAVPTSDFQTCLAARFVGSRHCAAAFSLQVPKSCTDLDPTLLYISTWGTYSKFVRKDKMLALRVCLPQPCLSAGHRYAESRSRLNYC